MKERHEKLESCKVLKENLFFSADKLDEYYKQIIERRFDFIVVTRKFLFN